MKKTLNRKQFLILGVGTAAAGLVGCAGDEGEPMAGTGGDGNGTGGLGAGTGGAGTGGAASGGSGSGGDAAGGSATGGGTASGGAGTGGGGGDACDEVTTDIGSNHGHEFAMAVSPADVAAGVEKVYDIQGTSPHPHTVTITAALFEMIASEGMAIIPSSTDNSHSHMVTVTCETA